MKVLKRIFYRYFYKEPYVPKLIGMRPLDNGRLALAFWNKKIKKEEVKVYDVWKNNPKTSTYYTGWYDREKFKSCYLYGGWVYWGKEAEFMGSVLYYDSELVKEDFQCLK